MSQEISKININNVAYNIKDATARAEVDALELEVANKVTDEFEGTVQNALDFARGIKINGATITCTSDEQGNKTVTFE